VGLIGGDATALLLVDGGVVPFPQILRSERPTSSVVPGPARGAGSPRASSGRRAPWMRRSARGSRCSTATTLRTGACDRESRGGERPHHATRAEVVY